MKTIKPINTTKSVFFSEKNGPEAATAGLAAIGLVAGAAQAEELRLYNWGDYINPDILAKFTEETGIPTVKFDVGDYDAVQEACKKVEEEHGLGKKEWVCVLMA